MAIFEFEEAKLSVRRTDWVFEYNVSELLAAAKVKDEFHILRLNWWKGKKEETLTKIKEEGIEVDDSLLTSSGFSGKMSNSYNRNTSVKINEQLEQDLEECVSKIKEHAAKVADYSAWIQVLEHTNKTAPLHSYPLTQADWLFFFGV